MPTLETHIATDRPTRYLSQLCKHASAMSTGHMHRRRIHTEDPQDRGQVRLHVERSDTHGLIDFHPWGRCTITAAANTLAIRIDATTEDNLRRIQQIITSDLERFGRREHLTMNWNQLHHQGE